MRSAPGNTILSQPYPRRVSIEMPIREGSQLAASLEGEPDPTPAGKTLPHSYPETRFRKERGKQRENVDFEETFVPTISSPRLRLSSVFTAELCLFNVDQAFV